MKGKIIGNQPSPNQWEAQLTDFEKKSDVTQLQNTPTKIMQEAMIVDHMHYSTDMGKIKCKIALNIFFSILSQAFSLK